MSYSLLLLSSSREGNTPYLSHAVEKIYQHLGHTKNVVFIPYAGITITYDEYTDKVRQALPSLNIKGIHQFSNPAGAIIEAEAIMVGGGNTFELLNQLYIHDLLPLLRELTQSGKPYVGWSAGANIAGQSIRTTNDMPIVEPQSFDALSLVPFQLNPHYCDYQPPNHNGETREQRIAEFTVLNPNTPVVGIREGTALVRQGDKLSLWGEKSGLVFLGGDKKEIQPEDDLSLYLTQ